MSDEITAFRTKVFGEIVCSALGDGGTILAISGNDTGV